MWDVGVHSHESSNESFQKYMEQNERYQLIFSGDVLQGHDPIKVGAKLAGLFRLSPAALKPAMAGESIILQNDLSYKQARRYQAQLETLGARVDCQSMAAPTVQVWEDDLLEMPITPPLAGPAIEGPLDTPRADQVVCPSCGQLQPRRTLCISCSVDMPRFIAAQERAVAEAEAARAAERQARLNKNGKKEKPEDTFKYDNYSAVAIDGDARIWGFSLLGRLARCRYLVGGYAIAIAIGIPLGILAAILPFLVLLIAIPFVLLAIYLLMRLIVLRLHDINLNGWWLIVYIVALAVIATFTPTGGIVIHTVATLGLFLWPGSSTDNDYGPKPEAPSGLMIGLAVILGAFSVFSSINSMKNLNQFEQVLQKIKEEQKHR